jgi:hypothetical protein
MFRVQVIPPSQLLGLWACQVLHKRPAVPCKVTAVTRAPVGDTLCGTQCSTTTLCGTQCSTTTVNSRYTVVHTLSGTHSRPHREYSLAGTCLSRVSSSALQTSKHTAHHQHSFPSCPAPGMHAPTPLWLEYQLLYYVLVRVLYHTTSRASPCFDI